MDWKHPEKQIVVLAEKELGDLVARVEARDTGSGQIMCQIELMTETGPLRRRERLGNDTSFTKHFKYSRGNTTLIDLSETAVVIRPEQMAHWLFVTAFMNWEGRLTPSKWDQLDCELHDGSLEKRMIQAFLADARNLLDSGLSCCVALHLTDLSIKYHLKVSRRLERAKVLECWDRGIVLDIMES
jgi:hypothetical protein